TFPTGNGEVVTGASFSRDESLVATGAMIGTSVLPPPALGSRVWRTRDGKPVAHLGSDQVDETGLRLSPDGRLLAERGLNGAGNDRQAVWRIATRTKVPALRALVAFDADGRRALLTRGRVVDLAAGTTVATLRGARELTTVVFKGSRLA